MRGPGTGPALAQGLFYLATGVWPLVSLRSFVAVTGPKREPWLVRTVGVLVGLTGLALVRAARRRSVPEDLAFLAPAMAVGLGLLEGVEAGRGRISRVYLLDMAVEAGLTAAWLVSRRRAGAAAHELAAAQAL